MLHFKWDTSTQASPTFSGFRLQRGRSSRPAGVLEPGRWPLSPAWLQCPLVAEARAAKHEAEGQIHRWTLLFREILLVSLGAAFFAFACLILCRTRRLWAQNCGARAPWRCRRPPGVPEAGRSSALAPGAGFRAPLPRYPVWGVWEVLNFRVGSPGLAVWWPAEGRRCAQCLGVSL